MINIKRFDHISLPLPKRRIMSRLGYNRHNTVLHRHHLALVDTAIGRGFGMCEPRGVCARIRIARRDEEYLHLACSATFHSRSLVKLLAQSSEILLMAATVGPKIMQGISEAIGREDAMRAAIFDAVGSETVDSILGWIQQYLDRQLPREGRKLTSRRFSPGYGDLGLENQKTVFELLALDQHLGLTLTERYLLVPEKSVIGIAGVM